MQSGPVVPAARQIRTETVGTSQIRPDQSAPGAARSRQIVVPVTSTDLSIRVETPTSEDAHALVVESQSALMAYLPEEEIFSIDFDELAAPNVTFLVARLDDRPVGCVALVDNTTYGEIKRLYVRDDLRGQGIARQLMLEVERYCRDIGLLLIRLETSPLLKGASELYAALGYAPCAPFGHYPVLESSLFMEKQLGRLG